MQPVLVAQAWRDLIDGVKRKFNIILVSFVLFVLIVLIFFAGYKAEEARREARVALAYRVAAEFERGNIALAEVATLRRECVIRGIATYVVDADGVSTFTWIKPLAEK